MWTPEVGDWVIITHREKELCIVGQVTRASSTHYTPGIAIDTYYSYDPAKYDKRWPGEWPTALNHLRVEPFGGPPESGE